MMPENIVKNMYTTMMPENIEKNMYLGRSQDKITKMPKKYRQFMIFWLKSRYYDSQKY